MEKKYSKRRRSQRILAVLFGAVILALSWVFLQNSLHIYEQSRGRTKQYLIDITYQLHEHIETQIQNSLEMLRLIRGLADLHIVGADVVEVAPAYDHAQITAVAASHVVYELVSAIAARV